MKNHYTKNEDGINLHRYETSAALLRAQYEQAAAAKILRQITHKAKISHIKL